jgi:hypothetical protein
MALQIMKKVVSLRIKITKDGHKTEKNMNKRLIPKEYSVFYLPS